MEERQDLISRQAAIGAAISADMENNSEILSEKRARVIESHINTVPSADVQPVVHGEWIPVTAIYKVKEDQFPQTERVWVDATEPDEIDAVKCSVCGEVFDFADARNWCTQCGAKMDKRKEADCTDCIKNGGDWECDHIHCHKGVG